MKRVMGLTLATLCAAAFSQDKPEGIGACYSAVWGDERAALVVKRIGVGQSLVPLELRASKAKANTKEKASLQFVAAGLESCRQQDQPNRAAFHPMLVQIINDFETANRDGWTKTYAGDLTWGGLVELIDANTQQFDKRMNELRAMAQAASQAEQERKAAQAIADAKAEEARKAALRADYERTQALQAQQEQARRANDQQQFMNGLMLLDAARPRPAPMMPFNDISCTSRNLNGTVHTNCR